MKKTIRDVAAVAGVSPATVSRVLNKSGYVSEQTYNSVMQAVKKLDYSPSALAVSLSKRQSNIIGVIVPDIYEDFFSKMVYEIEKMTGNHGYRVLLCNSDYNVEKEQAAIEDLMSYKVAGLIIVPTSTEGRDNARILNHIMENGTPVICIDNELPGFLGDGIYIDNTPGVKELVQTLAQGRYKRIAVLIQDYRGFRTELALLGTKSRLQVIKEELSKYQLDLAEERVLRIPAVGSCRPLLQKLFLDKTESPDVIISLSSLTTVSAVCALLACGVKIPDDIMVAGFDDLHVLDVFGYGMKTTPKAADLGVVAFQALFNRLNPIQKDVPCQRIVLPASMKIIQPL